MSLGATLGFALLVCVVLVLMFPKQALIEQVRNVEGNDQLSAAYIVNLLKTEPRNTELYLLLAQKRVALGEFGEAREALSMAASVSDPASLKTVRLMQYRILRKEYDGLREGDGKESLLRPQLLAMINTLTGEEWPVQDLMFLADEARELNFSGPAEQLTMRALESGRALPPPWLDRSARAALGNGDYRGASRLYFAARLRAGDKEDRRRYFLLAVRTLQSGNLLDEAMRAADAQIGDLRDDPQTLEFLTRLALAAGDPARAQIYVKRLLQLSALPADSGLAWLAQRLLGLLVTEAHAQVATPGAAPVPSGGGASESGAGDAPAAIPPGMRPYDEALYKLAYDVFLANNNAADAFRVALAAVTQRPGDMAWRTRLAQVAEFTGKAELALQQWLRVAIASGDENAYRAVLRLAPGLYDDEALLTAWQHTATQRPLSANEWQLVVDVYERLGRPGDAVTYLATQLGRRGGGGPASDSVLLDLMARVQANMGRVADAITSLERLRRVDPDDRERDLDRAIRLATLYFLKPDFAAAYRTLEPLRSRAGSGQEEYWRLLSDLAWQLQQDDVAREAYGVLVAQPKATAVDLERMVRLIRADKPEEAARLAEFSWTQFHNLNGLLSALEIHAGRGDRTALARLYAGITMADEENLGGSPFFYELRARYHLQGGRLPLALADYRRATALNPGNTGLRVAFLWFLIDSRQKAVLVRQLAEWSAEAQKNAEYWDAYAAGYVQAGEPKRAVGYLSRQAKQKSGDFLWLSNYADVLEESGGGAMAERIRRHAWLVVRSAGNRDLRDGPRERQIATARLILQYAPGDASLSVMRLLLRQDGGPPGEATKPLDAAAAELALGWAVSTEQHEAARAWLWQRYARNLAKTRPAAPLWAEVSVALAQDDKATLERLLFTRSEDMSPGNRIDAARSLQARQLAQTLGFEAQEKRPDDDEIHLRLATDLLAGASSAIAEDKLFTRGVLQGHDETARSQVWLTPRLRLTVELNDVRQHTADSTQLTGVPGVDRTLTASVLLRGDSGDTEVALARRDAMSDFTALKLMRVMRMDAGSAQLSASLRERAFETVPLYVGGHKDEMAASGTYNFSLREYVTARAWTARFHTQQDAYLGHGRGLSLETGHRLRIEYPDLSVRLSRVISHYEAEPLADAQSAQLSPGGAIPPGSFFVPKSFRLWGVNLSSGMASREDYSRALRPIMDIGRSVNSVSGNGYNWLVGAGGSVLGHDQLALYLMRSRGGGGTNVSIQEVGVRYQYFFNR